MELNINISHKKMEDQKIIDLIKARDERVIISLRKEYLPMVKYMVLNYTYSDRKNAISGTQTDVEDILHDAFYILINKITNNKITLTAKLKTYFYAICKNLLKHKLKKRIDELKFPYYDKNDVNSPEEPGSFYDKNLQRKAFNYYFNKLSPVCKNILNLYWLEYSISEISKELEIGKNYIMTRKYQCKNRLIKLIKENRDNY